MPRARVDPTPQAHAEPDPQHRKTVAIIGGGLSGIAAAKAAVQAGLFPTIFDRRPALGGMWTDGAATYDSLHTNVSHFTCSFSDFPWPSSSPDFPSAREMGQYLTAYQHAFLTQDNCLLQLGCEVLRVEPNAPLLKCLGSGGDGAGQAGPSWSVHWRHVAHPSGPREASDAAAAATVAAAVARDVRLRQPPPPTTRLDSVEAACSGGAGRVKGGGGAGEEEEEGRGEGEGGEAVSRPEAAVSPSLGAVATRRFDFVVVATGFCAVPYVPDIPGLATFPGLVLHSADYTGPSCLPGSCRRVAVIGSGHSAADIAADLAAAAAAGRSAAAATVDSSLKVVHVTPRPFWVIPRFLPLEPTAAAAAAADGGGGGSPFVPLDLFFHRRAARAAGGLGPEELVFPRGHDNAGVNSFFASLCGDQAKLLSPVLAVSPSSAEPAVSSISDSYGPLLVSGRLQLRRARLHRVAGSTLEFTAAAAAAGDEQPDSGGGGGVAVAAEAAEAAPQPLHDVDAIVLCTGLRPALPFLSTDLLSTLSYTPNDNYVPLALHRRVLHPDAPGLAFVGVFRSPFFAVVELQARLAAAAFTGTLSAAEADPETQHAGVALELRVRQHRPRPPYPHQDFVGHADGLAEALGALPPAAWRAEHEVVVSAHYAVHMFQRPTQPPPPAPPPSSSRTASAFTAATAAAAVAAAAAANGHGDMAAAATASEGLELDAIPTSAPPASADGETAAAAAAVRQALTDVAAAMRAYRSGRRVASAVFYALAGEWALRRSIISRLDSSPSGEVTGRASFAAFADADFTPCAGGAGGLSYLYDEQGQFAIHGGAVMRVRREYVYAYDSTADRIDVYFAAEGSGSPRGNFFHSLKFLPPPPPDGATNVDAAAAAAATTSTTLSCDGADGGGGHHLASTAGIADTADGAGCWRAVGQHLCGRDMYDASYKFYFQGIQLRQFEIVFRVTGPSKDYTATAVYTRPYV
ncbi:flavin-containing monooxygenase [Volvox carteri f. nagariensis]|uniref:Flavin-containing monooxygenase n=1 Tax=Volvox carteri f. nagariensis TaxID=3068 RepID=D8THT5_VOLCA|nr:flavin-containing monooxygenase [Volvox carteri f. nagariensis]EFJ53123.1 flavin-containing monooxygenase [Volvox carteri f. nagariensis]|eukprot:XP_002946128.1 flavin-containing monooxygenase [Volvox carteri f. nagariensis]